MHLLVVEELLGGLAVVDARIRLLRGAVGVVEVLAKLLVLDQPLDVLVLACRATGVPSLLGPGCSRDLRCLRHAPISPPDCLRSTRCSVSIYPPCELAHALSRPSV